MSNTNTKGRLLLCGAGVMATYRISPNWEMPEYRIPYNPSWAELNRGKQSKRQRRK